MAARALRVGLACTSSKQPDRPRANVDRHHERQDAFGQAPVDVVGHDFARKVEHLDVRALRVGHGLVDRLVLSDAGCQIGHALLHSQAFEVRAVQHFAQDVRLQHLRVIADRLDEDNSVRAAGIADSLHHAFPPRCGAVRRVQDGELAAIVQEAHCVLECRRSGGLTCGHRGRIGCVEKVAPPRLLRVDGLPPVLPHVEHLCGVPPPVEEAPEFPGDEGLAPGGKSDEGQDDPARVWREPLALGVALREVQSLRLNLLAPRVVAVAARRLVWVPATARVLLGLAHGLDGNHVIAVDLDDRLGLRLAAHHLRCPRRESGPSQGRRRAAACGRSEGAVASRAPSEAPPPTKAA
mmetsp:Transcript_38663/g.111687  ORF Transcript_38663/g.111687 Transcript_38663/m.111687 type:complete len:351 (-) Transcript_38663:3-1055(-)